MVKTQKERRQRDFRGIFATFMVGIIECSLMVIEFHSMQGNRSSAYFLEPKASG